MDFINIDNYTFRGIYDIEDLFSAVEEVQIIIVNSETGENDIYDVF